MTAGNAKTNRIQPGIWSRPRAWVVCDVRPINRPENGRAARSDPYLGSVIEMSVSAMDDAGSIGISSRSAGATIIYVDIDRHSRASLPRKVRGLSADAAKARFRRLALAMS